MKITLLMLQFTMLRDQEARPRNRSILRAEMQANPRVKERASLAAEETQETDKIKEATQTAISAVMMRTKSKKMEMVMSRTLMYSSLPR